MVKPLISVVVCTYNNAPLLTHCMTSLVNQTLNKDLFQVIVVDNNSKDNTQQIVKEFLQNQANFSLVPETNQGLSHARNTGWRTAQGKYVAFLDDDAIATPHWCQKIVKAFDNVFPTPIAVGGSIYPWYETDPPEWFIDDLEIRSWGKERKFLKGNKANFGFSGSNMAFPRAILKKYKGFSPKYGRIGNELRVGEDTELFLRIYTNEPFFWYDPDIKVLHWTPIRKMCLKYRIWRSFNAGQNITLIGNSSISLLEYCKKWAEFTFFLSKLPFRIMKRQKKANHIRLIEQLAFRLGSLITLVKLIHL